MVDDRTAVTGLRRETLDNSVAPGNPHDPIAAYSHLFKALGHEGRLRILFNLVQGDKSVTELEAMLGLRQAAVSQQLARLRLEGLVSARRVGKAIHYTLRDPKLRSLLNSLPEVFSDGSRRMQSPQGDE